ncbi:MAG: hypothetical protein KGK08_11760 [Acidobacteriota bacterium]|nr:hypothetical protein [Acidobacteriota bacterium]
MHANANHELLLAQQAQQDDSIPQEQRDRRLRNAQANQKWTSDTLLKHLETCSACRTRESALRPAYDPKKYL